MPDDAAFAAALAALRASYVPRLKQKVEEATALLGGVGTAAGLDALLFIAHELAGTGGTFGFPAVSAAARRLEAEARRLRELGPGAGIAALDPLVAELRLAAAEIA